VVGILEPVASMKDQLVVTAEAFVARALIDLAWAIQALTILV
jgi:hypothetical protein